MNTSVQSGTIVRMPLSKKVSRFRHLSDSTTLMYDVALHTDDGRDLIIQNLTMPKNGISLQGGSWIRMFLLREGDEWRLVASSSKFYSTNAEAQEYRDFVITENWQRDRKARVSEALYPLTFLFLVIPIFVTLGRLIVIWSSYDRKRKELRALVRDAGFTVGNDDFEVM